MKFLKRNMKKPEKKESLGCMKPIEKEKSLSFRNRKNFHSLIKNSKTIIHMDKLKT
jgi:hypothetical protein